MELQEESSTTSNPVHNNLYNLPQLEENYNGRDKNRLSLIIRDCRFLQSCSHRGRKPLFQSIVRKTNSYLLASQVVHIDLKM